MSASRPRALLAFVIPSLWALLSLAFLLRFVAGQRSWLLLGLSAGAAVIAVLRRRALGQPGGAP
jgi:chromate transport protein ChrA